jgi:C4-dicarboxylate transporter DctQ subunit
MRTAYVSFCGRLFSAIRVVIGVLLVLSVLLNLANVFGRYVLRSPVIGAEEVMLFLMIAIVFLGLGAVAWEGRHIKMDILLERLPPVPQHTVRVLIELSSIAVAIVIIVIALPVVEQLAKFNERSQAANVPLFIPEAFVPIGFGLLIIGTIGRLLDLGQRLGRSEIQMLEDG